MTEVAKARDWLAELREAGDKAVFTEMALEAVKFAPELGPQVCELAKEFGESLRNGCGSFLFCPSHNPALRRPRRRLCQLSSRLKGGGSLSRRRRLPRRGQREDLPSNSALRSRSTKRMPSRCRSPRPRSNLAKLRGACLRLGCQRRCQLQSSQSLGRMLLRQ